MSKNNNKSFSDPLLNWHATIDRKLPWKESSDPYKIWLSEIIMQQTRVAQGTPYYLKFVEAFPTVIDLADADEQRVMKLWQGLGYYSRARNLHFTAKTIRDNFNGEFPTEYEDILSLKGVGKYTAAAISSFAYSNEYPVVDGNVIRLISRYFGITDAVDSTQTIKEINNLAVKLIKGSNPGDYNQAIMDFGALICSPKSPSCVECPLNHDCKAYKFDLVSTIPYKSKKIKKKIRHFHYIFIMDQNGNTILNHRTSKDIWQSLYDFPCIENDNKEIISDTEVQSFINGIVNYDTIKINHPTKTYKHILSHQTIFGQFYRVTVNQFPKDLSQFAVVNRDNIDSYAFPVLLTNYLSDINEWTLF